jgi:hypothetical protein
MNIEAVAWGEKTETGDSIMYRMQAKIKGKREMNRLIKELSDWNACGEGYDPNTEKTIVLLIRKFKDKSSWARYAKTLSFPVEEINNRTGKRRTINARRRKAQHARG